MLKETASLVEKEHEKCEVQIHSVNATVTARMKEVASAVGGWDVLVLCAGRAARPQNVEDADSDLWWDVFEVRESPNSGGGNRTISLPHLQLPRESC